MATSHPAAGDGGSESEDLLLSHSSLRILRPRSLELLGQMLNRRMALQTEDGLLRDYRGLAEVAGLTAAECRRAEASAGGPARAVVAMWCRTQPGATVAALAAALGRIDRLDVLDDARELLLADCREAEAQGLSGADAVPDETLTLGALTMQDLEAARHGMPMPKFDAIVLHGEDPEDEAFAWHLTERLEKVGKKVFLPVRDLVAGTIEHSASVEIISRRCERVLALFSPSFMESAENKLYTDLAQYLGIQRQKTVVIPVMLKYCENLPANLNMISKLSYEPSRRLVNFYSKLYRTFGVTNFSSELLEYPEEFAQFSSRPPAAAAAPVELLPTPTPTAPPPQQPVEATNADVRRNAGPVSDEDFVDLTTASTTASEVDTVATTLSDLDTAPLPPVPTHEPGGATATTATTNQESKGRSKSKSFLKAVTKPFMKKGQPLMES